MREWDETRMSSGQGTCRRKELSWKDAASFINQYIFVKNTTTFAGDRGVSLRRAQPVEMLRRGPLCRLRLCFMRKDGCQVPGHPPSKKTAAGRCKGGLFT